MIEYQPIGTIYTPFTQTRGTPIQTTAALGKKGTIEIYPQFVQGLKDIEQFSHLILLYHLHLAKYKDLLVKPFLDNEMHGVFATRSPGRPNRIGFSIVRLEAVKDNILFISDVDIVSFTPLLDIKPYVLEFDQRIDVRSGWFENNIYKLPDTKDDGRFSE